MSPKKIIIPEPATPDVVVPVKTYRTHFFIFAGVAVLLVIILLFILFSRKKSDTSRYDELNKAYNEILSIRAEDRAKDSVAQIKVNEEVNYYKNEADYFKKLAGKNAQFYKDNEAKFRNSFNSVPVISDKDSLRAAGKIIK